MFKLDDRFRCICKSDACPRDFTIIRIFDYGYDAMPDKGDIAEFFNNKEDHTIMIPVAVYNSPLFQATIED